MDVLIVIGLPVQLRRLMEGQAVNVRLHVVPAGLAKAGVPRLLPHPNNAVYAVKQWTARIGDDEQALVVVLPYARVPDDVVEQLKLMEEILGAEVRHIVAGQGNWPQFKRSHGFGEEFLNQVAFNIQALLRITNSKPGAYLQELAASTHRLIIPPKAICSVDRVSTIRHQFIRDAGDALAYLAQSRGHIGIPEEEYFACKGLLLAQSGGIAASITITRNGTEVHKSTTHQHLKQGDKTTRWSAARIYFECVSVEEDYYVVILYAGPHPDRDVSHHVTI